MLAVAWHSRTMAHGAPPELFAALDVRADALIIASKSSDRVANIIFHLSRRPETAVRLKSMLCDLCAKSRMVGGQVGGTVDIGLAVPLKPFPANEVV